MHIFSFFGKHFIQFWIEGSQLLLLLLFEEVLEFSFSNFSSSSWVVKELNLSSVLFFPLLVSSWILINSQDFFSIS